jgi:hypothetical protein
LFGKNLFEYINLINKTEAEPQNSMLGTIQPDGSFKISNLDDTMGDAFRYGVAFLKEIGYFQSKDRFWTTQDFEEATKVQDRIKAKILSIGLNDTGLIDAYETINGKDF